MTRHLAADGFTWKRGMTSNVGAWSLVNPEGWTVAHAWRGNNGRWSACEDDGTIIVADTQQSEALRAADELLRPCAWVDPDPNHGIVCCGRERVAGSVYCGEHQTQATILNAAGGTR